MREREVIQAVAERLRQDGLLNLTVRYRGEPGPDIEGLLPRSRRRLFVEAKGERARPGERVALGEALLQILSRYDADVVCALALPFTERFEHLVRGILPGLRHLGLHLLLVRQGQVWHLGPQAAGFFPERPNSLLEALDR